MTVTPGVEPSPYPDSQARRNGDLPQGLKSYPPLPNPHYHHLGFNPVPGDTETVRGLHKKLSGCAKVLEETHELVTKLMDGSYWEGDAAVAFREQLDGGPLPLNLKNAARSIRKAARQLDNWEGELDDFQRRAKRLEEDAKTAQDAVDRAKGRATQAGDAPGLDKKGADHDAAKKALTRANSDVEEAEDELEKVRGKARTLAEEHEEKAKYRASKIRDATKKLAPHEPGWFDNALDFLADNLPDILSFVAGAVGLAVLLLAGPLGWSLMTVALLMLSTSAISLTAFSLRLSDGATWASLKDGFTKGEFDADFWSNMVSLGADFVGVLPGAGAIGKGGYTGVRAIIRGTDSLGFWRGAALYGTKTMDEAKTIAGLDNWVIARAVAGTSNPAKAAKAVAGTSGSVGMVTSGLGLYNNWMDASDDGVRDGTVAGIDGTRLVIDGGTLIDLFGHFR